MVRDNKGEIMWNHVWREANQTTDASAKHDLESQTPY